jgi:hypothetical protein
MVIPKNISSLRKLEPLPPSNILVWESGYFLEWVFDIFYIDYEIFKMSSVQFLIFPNSATKTSQAFI